MIVKVCGIATAPDARAAIDAGANALGFNFWPGSPRYLSVDAAVEFVPAIAGALRVGLFVGTDAAEIARVVERLRLDAVQLHGAASPPPGVRYWRAAAVHAGFDAALLDDPAADAYVLDAPAGARHGGTGQTFDWKLAQSAGRRIVLAGGLDGDNVAQAIDIARPWGVDACSRLESAPGRKDHAKVAAFVAAARAAFARISSQ